MHNLYTLYLNHCNCFLKIAVHAKTISSTFSNVDTDISVARILKLLILPMTCSTRILTYSIALVLITSEGIICEPSRLPGGTIK